METVSFVSPRPSMFPAGKPGRTLRSRGNRTHCFPRGQILVFFYTSRLKCHLGSVTKISKFLCTSQSRSSIIHFKESGKTKEYKRPPCAYYPKFKRSASVQTNLSTCKIKSRIYLANAYYIKEMEMCDMGRIVGGGQGVVTFEERKLQFSDHHLICLQIKIKR